MEVNLYVPDVDGIISDGSAVALLILAVVAYALVLFTCVAAKHTKNDKAASRFNVACFYCMVLGAILLVFPTSAAALDTMKHNVDSRNYRIQQVEESYGISLDKEQESDILDAIKGLKFKDDTGERVNGRDKPADLGEVWLSDNDSTLSKSHVYFMIKDIDGNDEAIHFELYVPDSENNKWMPVKPGELSEYATELEAVDDLVLDDNEAVSEEDTDDTASESASDDSQTEEKKPHLGWKLGSDWV